MTTNKLSELKFDRARFEAGELPIRTRDGRKLLHVHNSGLNCKHPIIAWVEGNDYPLAFRADGRVYPHRTDGTDLVHEPKMRKVRVLVYRSNRGDIGTVSEDEARDFEGSSDTIRAEGRLLHLLEVEVPE